MAIVGMMAQTLHDDAFDQAYRGSNSTGQAVNTDARSKYKALTL